MSPKQTSRLNPTTSDDIVDYLANSLLGRGLGYSDWEDYAKKQKIPYTGQLRNTLIRREFELFKDEILLLKAKPAEKSKRDEPKVNSLGSILKQLKGQPWMAGRPGEKKQRLLCGRLLGKDAKIRCLQNYVKDWEKEGRKSSNNPQAPTADSFQLSTKMLPVVQDDQTTEPDLDSFLAQLSISAPPSYGSTFAPQGQTYDWSTHYGSTNFDESLCDYTYNWDDQTVIPPPYSSFPADEEWAYLPDAEFYGHPFNEKEDFGDNQPDWDQTVP